ncbi:MAG: hypothetical protein KAT34_02925, partial [Candidatus Aminicenantes bacterium]|nr:hypothetical protein [Candidatus Aminicenantes bacterium]
FLVIMLILLFSFLLPGKKRKPPLPLAELQNPKGPSYVPIPYPQTREEIITDVKYVIKTLYPVTKDISSRDDRERRDAELHELLKKNGKLKFGKILKVKNYYHGFPEDYIILVDILDENDQLDTRMCFEASGLWAMTSMLNEELQRKLKPFRSKAEAEEYFYSRDYKTLGNLEIIGMERVMFGYSYISSSSSPVWVITTTTGTYYMDTKRYNVYRLEKQLSLKKIRSIDRKSSEGKALEALFKKYSSSVTDNVNDVLYLVDKITKTDIFSEK